MPQAPSIEFESLANLHLDPRNPRLGRHNISKELTQDAILDLMKDWTLDELAVSMLESGFWPQEALIVVKEKIPGKKDQVLVVVEGNRRLAAIMMLQKARTGSPTGKWEELIGAYSSPSIKKLEEAIPYILMPSRDAVQSYLGFRHVTGIKEWNPAEKAEFIAKLIEGPEKLSYDEVRKRIGSKTPTVRQNYISYRLLLQMEEKGDSIDIERAEDRFSVLFLAIRTDGVQAYLDIDIQADPKRAKKPVPKEKLNHLANFALWLFGDEKREPLFSDSRQVESFGRILESPQAVQYLERNEQPSFSVAKRLAGVSASEVSEHVELAADELEEALKAAHHHRTDKRLEEAIERIATDALQLLSLFPDAQKRVFKNFELRRIPD